MKNFLATFYIWEYSIHKALPSQPLLLDEFKSMTGNLNMGNHKIINLAVPTNNTDATNKTYSDTNFLKL